MNRRGFVRTAATARFDGSIRARSLVSRRPPQFATADSLQAAHERPWRASRRNAYRMLGSTGERVSAIGVGGSRIGKAAVLPSDSIRLMHEAIDRGISFMDYSWDRCRKV